MFCVLPWQTFKLLVFRSKTVQISHAYIITSVHRAVQARLNFVDGSVYFFHRVWAICKRLKKMKKKKKCRGLYFFIGWPNLISPWKRYKSHSQLKTNNRSEQKTKHRLTHHVFTKCERHCWYLLVLGRDGKLRSGSCGVLRLFQQLHRFLLNLLHLRSQRLQLILQQNGPIYT